MGASGRRQVRRGRRQVRRGLGGEIFMVRGRATGVQDGREADVGVSSSALGSQREDLGRA